MPTVNLGIDAVKSPEPARSVPPDDATAALERDLLNLEIKSREQDILHRGWFAWATFVLAVAWLALIIAIVLLDGFWFGGFSLPTTVLTTLIGTTTGTVLGLFWFVMRYLFPGNDKE